MKRGQLLRKRPLQRSKPAKRSSNERGNGRGLFWWAARNSALEHAGYACERCGTRRHPGKLTVHHRRRRSHGGSDDPSNLAALCWRCHNLIHDKLVGDWRCWIVLVGSNRGGPE